MSSTTVTLFSPGLIDYDEAWSWQRRTAAALREGHGPEAFGLLQHLPVYTLGRRARPESLLASREQLLSLGARVVDVDRGGDVTFHGPGQLVGYPILDLRSRGLLPGDYVRLLEQLLIDVLSGFGVTAERVPGRPGVWAGGGKIASIGVRVQGGVSTHGFALNVCNDLTWFNAIIPCGLADIRVVSMVPLLGGPVSLPEVEERVMLGFETRFGSSALRGPASAPEALPLVFVPVSRAAVGHAG